MSGAVRSSKASSLVRSLAGSRVSCGVASGRGFTSATAMLKSDSYPSDEAFRKMATPVSVPTAASEGVEADLADLGAVAAVPAGAVGTAIPVFDAAVEVPVEAPVEEKVAEPVGGGGAAGAPATESEADLAATPVVPAFPGIQVVAHELDDLARKEFRLMFPDAPAKATEAMRLVTLTFKTEHDQATFSAEVIDEREALLDQFHERASLMVDQLIKAGHWANYVDPSSGIAQRGSRSVGTFFESDDRYEKFGFVQKDFGCCKAIAHPTWGTHVYVGSVFTDAPKGMFN